MCRLQCMPSLVGLALSSRARRACEIGCVCGQDKEMCTGVAKPFSDLKCASCWAGASERTKLLNHLDIIFHQPEPEVCNMSSPSRFALYLISEAIELLTVDAFRGNPVKNDARTLRDSFLGSVATMGRHRLHIPKVNVRLKRIR